MSTDSKGEGRVLRHLISRLPQPVVLVDLGGLVQTWNVGAEEVYGYSQAEAIGKLRFPDLVDEAGRTAFVEYLHALEEGQRLAHREGRRITKDGRVIDVLYEGVVVPMGESSQLCLLELDITVRADAERRRELFVRELDHRVKNVLATVQAIAEGSIRSSSGSPERFRATLRVRLKAYAAVHEALAAASWEGLWMTDVVNLVFALYGTSQLRVQARERAFLSGDKILPLAMTLNELASNALFHGALSSPEGSVSLDWGTNADTGSLEIHWKESGGPPVVEAERHGFGLVLIRSAMPFQIGAVVDLSMPRDGVECRLVIPPGGPD